MERHMGNFHDLVKKIFFIQGTIYRDFSEFPTAFYDFIFKLFYLAVNIMLVFSLHQCGNLGTKLFLFSGRTFLSIVRAAMVRKIIRSQIFLV